ncbi:MAG: LLM class F420-dependent oxidoreductase [Acidimicrobiia bacterium]
MNFGVYVFPTEYSISAVELGRAVEERGFDSLFVTEHSHIPTSRRSPWPGGAELPEENKHNLDPFVALGAVTAATSRLLVGTGICLVVERDPIVTAKEVATLDLVSGGRFLFGVGGGWNREEMENHGTDPKTRFRLLRERVLAMKVMWTQEAAEFHGEFVDFDPLWSWPKPVQQPHPPVIVGGNGPGVLDRVLEYGDGWMPNANRGRVKEGMATLARRAGEVGREPIPVTIFGARPEAQTVEDYEAMGVERCLFAVPSKPADEVLPVLDRHAELAAKFTS